MEEVAWPAQSPELNALKTLGMSWNTESEPGPITQSKCLTSLVLLCLNGNESLQPCSNILKAFPEDWTQQDEEVSSL